MTSQNNGQTVLNMIDVDSLKWNELRQTVKQHGLPTTGKKIDLQRRLKNHLTEQLQQQQQQQHDTTSKVNTADDNNNISDEGKAVDNKLTAQAATKDTKAVVSTTASTLTSEQRRRMEENRKRALEIKQMREQKRLKSSSEAFGTSTSSTATTVITPATASIKKNPYKNPYAKSSITTPAAQLSSSSSATTTNTEAATVSATKSTPINPTPTNQHKFNKNTPPTTLPTIISAWGDCRLDLWENLCQCGGAARHSPDLRMCSCGAALDAGLDCQGCGGGVLLIKSGPRGNFWGCSNYKKKKCKFTMRFGSPHDAKAARMLGQMKQSAARKEDRERMERSRIQDRFEAEWRSVCHCHGAKNLNTFECKMQSEGGCGMLPLCPRGCGGQLFLHPSKFGSGKWWGCSNFRNGLCQFRADYDEHA